MAPQVNQAGEVSVRGRIGRTRPTARYKPFYADPELVRDHHGPLNVGIPALLPFAGAGLADSGEFGEADLGCF
jgi:hypothetical protein